MAVNQAIIDMLNRYECRNAGDYEHALREIFQELALLGLWRGKLFEHAAFYGGTALRIIHGLQRFSEDMDFSLITPDPDFDIEPYCKFVEKELEAWGFPVTVEPKTKRDSTTDVQSAFLKADTRGQLLTIEAPEKVVGRTHRNQKLKIKLEIDTNPPPGIKSETRFLLQPIPFPVRICTAETLFAGKMHAILFRNWKHRTKGRDWYDLVWFAARDIPVDINHLKARMIQTGDWPEEKTLSGEQFRSLLFQCVQSLDTDAARADVEPFLKNPDEISVWSQSFFEQIIDRLNVTTST